MSDRRGRRHSRYDDDDYYHDYEHRPRHRSLGRQALDKLEDAMGNLGLDGSSSSHSSGHSDSRTHHSGHSHGHHSSKTRPRRHSRDYGRDDRAVDRYYPPSSHHHRRYHSASPSRHSRRSRRDSTVRSNPRRAPSRSNSYIGRGVKAAVEAGAAEAFRLRHEPGAWTGEKGGRVATAAISAGVIGAATQHHREESGHVEGGKLGTLGSALGGMVVNRLVNGPRKEVRR